MKYSPLAFVVVPLLVSEIKTDTPLKGFPVEPSVITPDKLPFNLQGVFFANACTEMNIKKDKIIIFMIDVLIKLEFKQERPAKNRFVPDE